MNNGIRQSYRINGPLNSFPVVITVTVRVTVSVIPDVIPDVIVTVKISTNPHICKILHSSIFYIVGNLCLSASYIGVYLHYGFINLIFNLCFNFTTVRGLIQAKHATKGNHTWGVNGETGQLQDMKELGVWDTYSVKAQTVKTALEVQHLKNSSNSLIILEESAKATNTKT